MSYSTNNLRFPAYAQANQPRVSAERSCPFDVDPVLEARKGRLYLLSAPDAQPELLRGAAEHYYGRPSYDIVPGLEAALVWCHRREHGLQGEVLLAAVVHDLSLYVVGTDGAEAYLCRSGGVTPLLAFHSFRSEHALGGRPEPDGEGAEGAGLLVLRNTKSRLCFGDWAVLAPRVDTGTMHGILRGALRTGDPERAAQRVAAALRKRARVEGIAGVIAMPGLSAVPGVGFEPKPQPATPEPPGPPALPAPREGHSPIWIALLIATIAVAVTLWVKKPQINLKDLSGLVTWMLTPSPTLTVEPTPEPAE